MYCITFGAQLIFVDFPMAVVRALCAFLSRSLLLLYSLLCT